MDEMDDLPLDPEPPRELEPEPKPLWPWVVGLLIVTGVVAMLVSLRQNRTPQTTEAVQQSPSPAPERSFAPRAALGPAVDPVVLPPLASSDAAMRDLVKALSSRPEVLAWLATDGLIRNLAVCIENVAEGKTPARRLKAVAPTGAFRAAGFNERYTADPGSFARYDGMAGVVGALDMSAVARLYAVLKPRLDEAYQELGHKPGDIDGDVERGLLGLLATPTVPGDAPLTRVVLSYRYVDDDVEALSGAQKQLLRLGPRNAQTVLAKLRELALALGIPAARIDAAGPQARPS